MVKKYDSLALGTNVVIDILNGKQEIIDKYLPYTQIYLPFIVCGELLFGAHNSSGVRKILRSSVLLLKAVISSIATIL